MKYFTLTSLLFAFACLTTMAEKATFDKKFSVFFPEGWKKAKSPDKGAIIYRETEKFDASFAIAKLKLPENSKANLKATVESMVAGMKKNMTFIEDPKSTLGKVDGKKAYFTRIITKAGDSKMGFYLVAVDAGDRVFILQATLPAGASDQSRADCMKIIQSFKEEKE